MIGLNSSEVLKRQAQFGLNFVEEKHQNRVLDFLKKFWAPVPWMLEVTIILELILRKYDEALIIVLLLLFNSLLSFFQETKANKALLLLKQHLSIQARVFRDGKWQLVPAKELVPGDLVHVRMGDIVPADIHLKNGKILLDQSILTGESLAREAGAEALIYSSSTVRHGEADGEVSATGSHTYFGKSVDLIQKAQPKSHIKQVIFKIVQYLMAIDLALIVLVLIDALMVKLPVLNLLAFVLILLVASVPVALPVTFAVATAMGAMRLTKQGVLVTSLSVLEEAAMVDVLCIDKTGTLTKNQLALATSKAFPPYADSDLRLMAAVASDAASQDPIDEAILTAVSVADLSAIHKMDFIPFDPERKLTEAVFEREGQRFRVLKGAPDALAKQLIDCPVFLNKTVQAFAEQSYRVLAVAIAKIDADHPPHFNLVGVLAFEDPPREDSESFIGQLKELGLKMMMLTGDGLITAQVIAKRVGIGAQATVAHSFLSTEKPETILNYDVFASTLPQDKFQLVGILQRLKHVVGMTGDGVNDAPTLKQADMGVAVSNATDVAKASSTLVLLKPGLQGIIAAVQESRQIYHRMLTYTLNKIIKSLEIIVFLSLGMIFTGQFIITPLLIVLLIFTNDFMTMSIATDRVIFSPKPERWSIGKLVMAGCSMAGLVLILSFAVFVFAEKQLHLPLRQLQTLIFVMLVFTGQGNLYLIRTAKHFWCSRPGGWLIVASVVDILLISIFASQGILMAAINPLLILALLGIIVLYLFAIDFAKVRIFAYLKIIH